MKNQTVKEFYVLSDLRMEYDTYQDYMKNEFNEQKSEMRDTDLCNIAVDFYTREMKSLNERNLQYIIEQKAIIEKNRRDISQLSDALKLDGKEITIEQLVKIEVLPEFQHITNASPFVKCTNRETGIPFQWFIVEFIDGRSIDVYIEDLF